MSEPIYTDKNYLDAQFGSLHASIGTLHAAIQDLQPLKSDVAVLEDWRITHDKSHTRFRKVGLTIAGLLLTAAGLLSRIS